MAPRLGYKKHGQNILWTDDKEQFLRDHYGKPAWPASRIAEHFGGGSRFAVIGKAHRMGIKGGSIGRPARDYKAERARRVKTEPDSIMTAVPKQSRGGPPRIKPPTPYVEPPMPVLSDDAPPLHSRTYIDLEDGMCKWPVYIEQGVQMYCGAVTGPRQPYCAHHDRASHQKEPRRIFVPYKRRSITGGYT